MAKTDDETTQGGIKPDKWLKHQAVYSESQIKLQEATSENQVRLKAAKADGIHIDALKTVSKLNRKDPAEAAVFLRAVLEGALIQGCAFMHQADMLNGGSIADMFKIDKPSAKAVEQFKESEALQIGYDEGLNGGSIENLQKQFDAGSAGLTAAVRGFKRGRDFVEASAQPGVTPVAAARGRRGGRKAAGAAEEAEAPKPEPAKPAHDPDGDPDFDEPLRGTDDPDDGEEGEAASSEDVPNMIEVQKMSNVKMAALWNKLTGQNIPKFESRAVGLSKLTQLYSARQHGAADAHAN